MLEASLLLFCFLLPLLLIVFKVFSSDAHKSNPFTVNFRSIYANRHHIIQWISEVVNNSPTLTIIITRPFSQNRVMTANPAVVHHILQTNFSTYPKGEMIRTTLSDLLGEGIFNVDGDSWKFQRQISSHEFSTKSLRHFVEDVVDFELNQRLIPMLTTAAANHTVLDLQDILQRFTFDNICKIAFGYDPGYLTSSLAKPEFAVAFEDAVRIIIQRFLVLTPILWKIKRFLNVGSEKRLSEAVSEIQRFAREILNERKRELAHKSPVDSGDLLSRFISYGYSDEKLLMDIVISFILAGRDTTSAALTWFLWLLFKNPAIESEIVREIKEISDSPGYDEVKDMVYTHASLCESMRLYPPVPLNSKVCIADDILPDGTVTKKGTMVTYNTYAMGRVEKIWGGDWMEFRPERWLEKHELTGKVRFAPKDSYMYPVFQAGPRICLGKDMAILQMKKVVASVLRRFKVVPAVDVGSEPVLQMGLTMRMKDGFPVRIVER
ncbi:putative cytochrome P450 [Helianthus annuus]|nr:cytochrome P450 94A1 [Helianthus annuus]KAJ0509804.1 putative cytochrome P450 [Helianthus annuus]KAJ0871067.1 putative cytochrome P450 [Helianthus annuus]